MFAHIRESLSNMKMKSASHAVEYSDLALPNHLNRRYGLFRGHVRSCGVWPSQQRFPSWQDLLSRVQTLAALATAHHALPAAPAIRTESTKTAAPATVTDAAAAESNEAAAAPETAPAAMAGVAEAVVMTVAEVVIAIAALVTNFDVVVPVNPVTAAEKAGLGGIAAAAAAAAEPRPPQQLQLH